MTQPTEPEQPSKAQEAAEAVVAYEALQSGKPDPFLPLRWLRVAAIRRWERAIAPAFKHLVERYIPEMERRISSGGVVDPAAAFSVKHEFASALEPIVEIEIREILEDGFRDYGSDDWTPDATHYVNKYLNGAFNRLVGVPNRVFNQVRREVHSAVGRGDAVEDLAARIHDVLARDDQNLWSGRAMVIARTEVISAYNAGTFAGMVSSAEQAGGVWLKGWLSTEDHRVRPTHAAADFHTGALAQTVALAAPFIVGGAALMFPGDPTGPPQEVIQCRCSLVMMRPGEQPAYANKHFRGMP